MISTINSMAAERAIEDKLSNRSSLIDIIDRISALSFPHVIPNMVAFFILRRQPDDPSLAESTLSIKSNNTVLARMPIKTDFQSLDITRLTIGLEGLPIPEPGTLSISLSIGDNQIGEISIGVHKIDTKPLQVTTT